MVAIRYSSSSPAATSTTGSPTVVVVDGFRTYTWRSNGSVTL
jgi:hypothetical protein